MQHSSRKKSRKFLGLGLFVLTLFAMFCVGACGDKAPPKVANTVRSPTEVRVVQHAMGETKVPLNPQRVVAIGFTVDPLLSLGVKPMAVSSDEPEYLQSQLEGVVNIGTDYAPNLEKILALKPDLILGSRDLHKGIYNSLSYIAPTVMDQAKSNADWKDVTMLVAKTLGKTEKAEQVMANYYARLEEFKAQMGDRLNQIEVSVIRPLPSQIELNYKDVFPGTILKDANLRRPPAQDKDSWGTEITKESFRDADGDVIFMYTWGSDSQNALKKLKADPLWSQLDAVKHNQVCQVGEHWISHGPIAANLVIDDLFECLVEDKR